MSFKDGIIYFKVKRENKLQEITQEEVTMPFLHLFAKGAQVLEAGLPFHLEDRHFAKLVSLNDWAGLFKARLS